MSYSPSTTSETEFDELPILLPEQEGVLVGRVESEELDSALAAYYVHWRGHIVLGVYEEGEFLPTTTVEEESQVMADQVRTLVNLDVEPELSEIGKNLLKAWHIADLTTLGTKESHVYALREVGGFDRQLTADILNISPSTVDSHLQAAKRKRREAQNLLSLGQDDSRRQQSRASDHDPVLVEVIDEIDEADEFMRAQ